MRTVWLFFLTLNITSFAFAGCIPGWPAVGGPCGPSTPVDTSVKVGGTVSRSNSYIKPSKDTRFAKVLELFDKGSTPDLSAFNPDIALKGKSCVWQAPDVRREVLLVSLKIEDEIEGIETYANAFVAEYNGKPVTLEEAKAELVKEIEGKYVNVPSPLVFDLTKQLATFRHNPKDSSEGCGTKVSYRISKTSTGQSLLIMKVASDDGKNSCNPNEFGAYNGDVFAVAYFLLP